MPISPDHQRIYNDGRLFNDRLPADARKKVKDAYDAKMARNVVQGMSQLYSGEIRPFGQYDEENIRSMFNIILIPSEETKNEIRERVIDPTRKLAAGLPVLLSGRGDIPSHITLDMAKFVDADETTQKAVIEQLGSNSSHLSTIQNLYRGLTFHLDNLVVAPNSYISSSFRNEQVIAYRTRILFEKILTKAVDRRSNFVTYPHPELKPPYPYTDVFHSSILRFTDKPDPQQAVSFVLQMYQEVGESLKKSPIDFKVEEVRVQTSFDFINDQAPHLIKRRPN